MLALSFLALAGVVFALPAAHAQSADAQETGAIEGVVVDGETGKTLPGANVVVVGEQKGASTGVDGGYRIDGLAPGAYDLKCSFVSYQPKTITGVEVAAGETATLDVTLNAQTQEREEVVVTAKVARNSEAGLLQERQGAAAVSNAISAEKMSQTGSGDVADAMSQVTGATVTGGKYVNVRGLGGRYGLSQLNGANLPSADPDRNSVQLDLFPTELLSSIAVTKTFTPDKPGNFSGGSVDIRTSNFPTELKGKVSTSAGYNSQSSLNESFLTGPSGGTDFLGFDDGLRSIPSVLSSPSVQIPQETVARTDPALARELHTASQAFNNTIIPIERQSGLNNEYSFSLGNEASLFGRSLGFVASGNYSRKYDAYVGGQTAQFQASDPSNDSLVTNYRFDDTRGVDEARWGLQGNLSYAVHPNHQLSATALRTQSGEQLGRRLAGPFPKNSPASTVSFETFVLGYTERSAGSYQLQGEHFFENLLGLRADWNASYSRTTQEEPDLRYFFNQFRDAERNGTTERVRNINLGSSNATPPTRLFRDLVEDNREAGLNLELPVELGLASPVTFKTGGSYLSKDRTFRERKFDYDIESGLFTDVTLGTGSTDALREALGRFFGNEFLGVTDTTAGGRFQFGNVLTEGTLQRNNYDGTTEVAAAYGMAEVPILSNLRLIAGARFEQTDIEVVSRDSTVAPGRLQTGDLLPSVNLVYGVTEKMNVRLAAARTLARPTFREIAPFQSFSFAGGSVISGNPDLNRTLINNYDVRWEWFTNPGEVLAVSGFYKYFQEPIERVLISDNDQITFQNVPRAQVFGAEFEVRQRMGWLAEPLENLTAAANLTLIESRVDVPQRELDVAQAGGFDISDTRPFQEQSPYVLNLNLAYDIPRSGTSANVSFNRFGKRLVEVSFGGTPNIYEFGRNDLRFSVNQRLFAGIEAKLSVDNVLNDSFVEGQEYNGTLFKTYEYDLGRTYKLTVSYNL